MNPLLVGCALAAILAGPSLYSMVQNGQLDGSSALLRGLVVAGICAIAVTYVMEMITGYNQERERKANHQRLLRAIAEAEVAKKKQAAAEEQVAKLREESSGKSS